jgi:hypothetical protein
MNNAVLLDVVQAFGLPEAPNTACIAKPLVLDWMKSDDMEVLGALQTFLSKARFLDRVKPGMSRDELSEFALHYYGRCLRENQEGEWALGRYGAAWDIASWFRGLWSRGVDEIGLVERIKSWLGELYVQSDADVRRCIVDGALEHMFEERAIRAFFADWKKDPTLSVAFAEASEWVDGKR